MFPAHFESECPLCSKSVVWNGTVNDMIGIEVEFLFVCASCRNSWAEVNAMWAGEWRRFYEHTSHSLDWTPIADGDFFWECRLADETLRIRLNDYPNELLYSFFVGEECLAHFNEWPQFWNKL